MFPKKAEAQPGSCASWWPLGFCQSAGAILLDRPRGNDGACWGQGRRRMG